MESRSATSSGSIVNIVTRQSRSPHSHRYSGARRKTRADVVDLTVHLTQELVRHALAPRTWRKSSSHPSATGATPERTTRGSVSPASEASIEPPADGYEACMRQWDLTRIATPGGTVSPVVL